MEIYSIEINLGEMNQEIRRGVDILHLTSTQETILQGMKELGQKIETTKTIILQGVETMITKIQPSYAIDIVQILIEA